MTTPKQTTAKCPTCNKKFTVTKHNRKFCRPYCRWVDWAARHPRIGTPQVERCTTLTRKEKRVLTTIG